LALEPVFDASDSAGFGEVMGGSPRSHERMIPAVGEGLQTACSRAGYLSGARGVRTNDRVAVQTAPGHLVSPTAYLVDFYWLSSSI
jgi:hypothetical protein